MVDNKHISGIRRHCIVYLLYFLCTLSSLQSSTPLYISTAANAPFFDCLINLIGSIHKTNFEQLGEIAIFDIGLTQAQRTQLSGIQKVVVCDLEKVHPDILKLFRTRTWGKPAPGWYAWKAVVLKQSLDRYPYVLFLDAGTTVLGSLSTLFDYIQEHGYFLHNGAHMPINKHVTHHLINKFDLTNERNKWILQDNTYGVEAGCIGCARIMREKLVMPFYELAKDLRNFSDDGTAPGGFGNTRHDTSVLSVLARITGLTIHQHGAHPKNSIILSLHNKEIPFHITWDQEWLTPQTVIYCSRHDLNLAHLKSFIRYRT